MGTIHVTIHTMKVTDTYNSIDRIKKPIHYSCAFYFNLVTTTTIINNFINGQFINALTFTSVFELCICVFSMNNTLIFTRFV